MYLNNVSQNFMVDAHDKKTTASRVSIWVRAKMVLSIMVANLNLAQKPHSSYHKLLCKKDELGFLFII